ncbi:MAG: trimethyllysine dioxygenase [Alphaproteobacteria bacterium]|nr:trimethyllysine dioxygenase [Alphaproteobacteria bacterium]
MPNIRISEVVKNNRALTIKWADGKEASFPCFWLRDHCPEPESLNKDTWQREVDTFSIPEDIDASTHVLDNENDVLSVTWSNDSFVSRFPGSLLREAAFGEEFWSTQVAWDKSHEGELVQWHDFDAVMNTEEGLNAYLATIEKYGFALVDGLGNNMENTRKFAERISYIRESIFGGLWDFKADLAHNDTAYSTVGIGPHTDSTYSFDAPGLQMLHCLEYKAQGGLSVFVDGLKVAERIRNENPELFKVLTEVEVTGRYIEPGVHLKASRPVIKLDNNGNIRQVSYNNFDRAPFLLDEERMKTFYKAIGRFDALINDPDMQAHMQLTEGKAVVFDNWRVLHARTSFSGLRHFAGAYLNREDYESRIRVLRAA